MKPVHHLMLATFFGMLLSVAQSPALAQTYNTQTNSNFAGSMCRKVGSSGSLAITNDGAIYNNVAYGGATLVVDCPVVSSGQGWTTYAPSKLVYLDHSTGYISCSLSAEAAGSTAVRSISRQSTGDDSSYRALDLIGLQTYVDGFIHLRCTLPPKDSAGNPSYVVGYVVSDEPTNSSLTALGSFTSPASACRRVTGGQLAVTADGAIYNTSSTELMEVDCPVLTTYAGAGDSGQAFVTYLDSSPLTLGCTLVSEDADSTANSLRSLFSAVDENYYHTLSFTSGSAVSLFDGGFVHIRCTIPPKDSANYPSYIIGFSFEPY